MAQALVYQDTAASLQAQMHILQGILQGYPIQVLHVCPGSLMRYFKKIGDAALATGDVLRCRYLLQWGTTYRLMAVARWYNRITANPAWTKETLPPEAMVFDAEYQGTYDIALHQLYDTFGVKPKPLQAPLGLKGDGVVEVMAVCLYSDRSLPDLASRNHELYCSRHGYRYNLMREVPEGGWERLEGLPKEAHYWKIQQTLDALERPDGPEWVLSIDCDAFFTNASISVLDVAEAYGAKGLFYVAEDPAGINTGVLLFRRHEWTREFLRRVLQTPFVQIWDQSQYFWQLLQEFGTFSLEKQVQVPAHISLVHQSHLNAYHSGTAESWNAYGWQPGDYIVHYAGCPWDMKPCWEKMEVSAHVIEEQMLSS